MRFAAALVFWLATTAGLMVAVPTVWTQRHVVDVDGYTDSDKVAEKALADINNVNALGSSNAQCAFTIFRFFDSLRAREVVTDALPARACLLAHERRTRG